MSRDYVKSDELSTPRDVFVVTACSGKESYSSPQLAHRRLAEMKKRGKFRRKSKSAKHTRAAYRCTVCGQWHLGGV